MAVFTPTPESYLPDFALSQASDFAPGQPRWKATVAINPPNVFCMYNTPKFIVVKWPVSDPTQQVYSYDSQFDFVTAADGKSISVTFVRPPLTAANRLTPGLYMLGMGTSVSINGAACQNQDLKYYFNVTGTAIEQFCGTYRTGAVLPKFTFTRVPPQ